MTNKDRTIFKLYKRAYDSKVDELTDIFAEEDKNAAENAGSLSTRTLVSGGAGLLGGLLLTKLLDADNSAGFGRYALMGALGAGLGAGAGYYFNKPAVTSAEERDKMLDEAATQDEETAKIDAKEGAKARNHLIGQSGASVWTIADLRRRIRRHLRRLRETLDIENQLSMRDNKLTGATPGGTRPNADDFVDTAKYNEAHGKWAAKRNMSQPMPQNYIDRAAYYRALNDYNNNPTIFPHMPNPDEFVRQADYDRAMSAYLEGQNMPEPQRADFVDRRRFTEALDAFNSKPKDVAADEALRALKREQADLKMRGYVIGEDGIPKLTGKGQLKGLGKALGLGVARHGAFALAAALLNKAL